MQEHTDEITALAVSPCGKWIATGETGANPKVPYATVNLAGFASGLRRHGAIDICRSSRVKKMLVQTWSSIP